MSDTDNPFCTIEEALEELRTGRMIVLVDDEFRENEGDLVIPADRVTPEAINFMLTHARGILCLAMSAAICDRLRLDPQTTTNSSRMGTAFTVKFDARNGIETGTSAYDRCRSIQVAVDPVPHLALCKGGIGVAVEGEVPVQTEPVLVRIHSQCLTGDIFESLLCDCGSQLHRAMRMVDEAGKGVVLYMRQEGRGIGLLSKLKAYQLQQNEGLDTVEANKALGFAPDLRHYGIGAQILVDLGIRGIRLMTNNPKKIVGLDGYGLRIVEQVPIQIPPNQKNRHYLKTKREKLGHLLDDME